MFDPNLRNLVVGLFFVAVILMLYLEERGRRRQNRLDRLVFKPSASIVALGPMANSKTEWLVDLILIFCLPEDLQKPPKELRVVEYVDVRLTFRWDDRQKRYLTSLGTILRAAKERGLGRKWSADLERKYWTTVEGDVAAAILEREWSTAQLLHGVAS